MYAQIQRLDKFLRSSNRVYDISTLTENEIKLWEDFEEVTSEGTFKVYFNEDPNKLRMDEGETIETIDFKTLHTLIITQLVYDKMEIKRLKESA